MSIFKVLYPLKLMANGSFARNHFSIEFKTYLQFYTTVNGSISIAFRILGFGFYYYKEGDNFNLENAL